MHHSRTPDGMGMDRHRERQNMREAAHEDSTNPDEMVQPIDIDDVYIWDVGGHVKIDGMYIDEDGNTQVRVIDRSDRRTIDAETVHDLVSDGQLEIAGKVDDFSYEPWTQKL